MTLDCPSTGAGACAAPCPRCPDIAHIELPDGRVLAFAAMPVVAFNLTEAQRRASAGARTRQQAIEELYQRDDGTWGLSDPVKELDLVTNLAAAVLFAYAAVEGLGDQALEQIERDGGLGERLAHLSELREQLVHPRSRASGSRIFGRLIRGDADGCAEDAWEVVKAVRPELLPPAE